MAWAVEFDSISKSFSIPGGGLLAANSNVSFQVESGSIHAVLGENGAGKSTIVKTLFGLVRPDRGSIRVRGEIKSIRSPQEAQRLGIGMVHQHFMLSGTETALDNAILGLEPCFMRGRGPIDRIRARGELEQTAENIGQTIPWDTLVRDLPIGVQQRLEIIKTLWKIGKLELARGILILDEPTGVLSPPEVEAFLKLLKKLKLLGTTVLIITHKLAEVMEVADSVTIMRAGIVVSTLKIKDTNKNELSELILGVKLPEFQSRTPLTSSGEVLLSIPELSIEVSGGEIVGIAGVEGNGQQELLERLMNPCGGAARMFGREIGKCSNRDIRNLGVAMIPEDRQREGLVLSATLLENFALAWPRLKGAKLLSALQQGIQDFDIRPTNPGAIACSLSGGNQQKLLVARELHGSPKLILSAQPTRGVDLGAQRLIHTKLTEARSRGAGILLVSSDLDEVLLLADRILVLSHHRVAARFAGLNRGTVDLKQLGAAMGGACA